MNKNAQKKKKKKLNPRKKNPEPNIKPVQQPKSQKSQRCF